MRIATWNINGMNARLGYLSTWLEKVKPDVVGLQELKMVEEKFPRKELEALGYQAAVHGQKSWNGVAVLTRGDHEVHTVGLRDQEAMGSRLIEVETANMTFTTVYCPNGKNLDHEDYGRKLDWFDSLNTYVRERLAPDKPAVLCGDFNIVPTALDTWSEPSGTERIFHTVAERERLSSLTGWGLTDLYRDKYPDEPGFTWWDYRAGSFHKGRGLRIDMLLATAPIHARVEAVTVERDWRKKVDGMTPSDHAPLWADLRDE